MNASRVAVGDMLGGRYRIEALLGEGGMAIVYQVRHASTGRPCALKLVHEHLVTQPQLVDLFLREAQVGSKIGQNPHIVDVLDAGVDEARRVPFLVMELLQGETLEHWCARHGPMPPALVRDLFEQLGDALGQAHRAGVIHRDLKPSNLFLTADHKGMPLLKVVDFGIAKVLEADHGRTATQIGTPSYAAPEQFGAMFRPLAERQGIVLAAGVSPATDIWPLGLIAYELLTGAVSGQFWDTATAAEMPIKAVLGEVDPPTRRAGERAALLPPGFDAWFARCLRKNAAERWPTVGHAVSELTRLLSSAGPVVAGTVPGAPAGVGYAIPPTTSPHGTTPAPYGTPPSYGTPVALSGPFTPAPIPQGQVPQPMPQQMPMGAYPGAPAQAQQWPGPAPFIPAPPAAKPAKSSGCLIAAIAVGGVLLLIFGVLGFAGVRRYKVAAAAHECETEKTQTHCQEACDASDMPSCARLGVVYELGKGTARDLTKAAELYRRACNADDLIGCGHLAYFHLMGRGGAARDSAEAKRLATRACDANVQRGCAVLGELTRDGEGGVTRDDARALGLFKAACDGGDMLACKDLGAMHEYGRGGLKADNTRAATLYKQACEGGDAAGCNDLGVMVGNGTGVPKDDARAATLYKQACEGGELIGCTNLGIVHEYGRGVPKDVPKAISFYKQACDEGAPGGCSALGLMYELGKGVGEDTTKAVALYKQACEGHHPTGCFYLGTMEEAGKGTAKDETKAVEHYTLACNSGNPQGCTGLGVMTEYGKGGLTKDESKAATLYKQACENGVLQACSNYGLMLDGGRGVAKDPAHAVTFFKQACDGDNSAGCSNLGWHYVKGIGIAKDHVKGLELLRKGCNAGYEWGCEQLKAAGGSR